MCGISGIATVRPSGVQRSLIETMARTMRHRGPDEEGFYLDPEQRTGLGFQRLAIIDLSGGHQPMPSTDERFHLVFNGEIYNYRELRADAEAVGSEPFRTASDTEVLLRLYQRHGTNCLRYLRGMFAFAIWDRFERTLFLARDRFGKKPLVYAELPGELVFASELRALLSHPLIRKEIDDRAIDLYLTYQYIPSPLTIFKQIRKLPPAHYLLWKDGEAHVERYWEPPFLPKTALSFGEAKEQLRATLREATRLRMIADVPLGAFLSGGKDSSIVVGLMSELSNRPIKTFSIGFDEQDFSELPYARRVAEHFKTDHQEFVVKADMVDVLPKLAWHYGEPYADPSALPSYYLAKMTRQHVTVALNGDGGDETMAGYPRYQAMKFMAAYSEVPRPLRQWLSSIAERFPDGPPPHSKVWRIKRLLKLGLDDPSSTYVDTLCFFSPAQKRELFTDEWSERTQGTGSRDYLNGILSRAAAFPGTDRYLYTDLLSYLPECLMAKIDIATMANSLEARSPFLDHVFVEFAGRLPPEWKLRGLTGTKHIINETFKGWLPDEVLTRRKQGFSPPMSHWFRGRLRPFLDEMLLSPRAQRRGFFRADVLRRYLDDTQSGRMDHTYRLWALLMLEQWFRTYMDGEAVG